MITFTGKGVCGGYVLGKALLLQKKKKATEKQYIADAEEEKKRINTAVEQSVEQLKELYETTLKKVGVGSAEIFQSHIELVRDQGYRRFIDELIEQEMVNAEYAVWEAEKKYSTLFRSMDDDYFKERATDIEDVSHRIIQNLVEERREHITNKDKVILCAKDLAPSEIATLGEEVLAVVLANGSSRSHTAILAKDMNLPLIVDVGEKFIKKVKAGKTLAVDSHEGIVYVDPDDDIKQEMKKKKTEDQEEQLMLQDLKGLETKTLNGKKITISANVDEIGQLDAALQNDAEGIGLLRSEFIYLERDDFPTEEEQFEVYKKALEQMAGQEVIIRTLDFGGDKHPKYWKFPKEENPALGYRGIRATLREEEILKTQLRALYRASAYGKLGIMFPFVTYVCEVNRILELCETVKQELQKEGKLFSDDVELGVMIETPAAALVSEQLAPMVDFFSIGTNDLIQYTNACDRNNPALETFCDKNYDAIFKLITMSIESAHKYKKWIGVSGELASNPEMAELLIRMGVDELSVAPSTILKMRDVVRKIDLKKRG
ncbi:MAG: phosphoenolpyruvate--protein phosphotransferase [Eubacterium sp.]|nr:phosphoenolpyruvate--protein phosphotransferase [Eubacterium sp.]